MKVMRDMIDLWCQQDAEKILTRLLAAYLDGELGSLLYGNNAAEIIQRILRSSLDHRLSEINWWIQGIECEHRRAMIALPADWESQRFRDYVGGAANCLTATQPDPRAAR